MAKSNGFPVLGSGFIRPSTTPQPEAPDDDQGDVEATAGPEGDGGKVEGKAPRQRRRRPPAEGKVKPAKLHLPESVCDRLHLLAFQRRTTASAVAAEILDRGLPRFKPLERE
jgi:hypothetical protein